VPEGLFAEAPGMVHAAWMLQNGDLYVIALWIEGLVLEGLCEPYWLERRRWGKLVNRAYAGSP
jgi:hypothetical protein